MKAFADDSLKVALAMIYVYVMIKKNEEKGQNAGYQHFLLFPLNVFKNLIFQGH